MKLLMLGGTVFLGRHITQAALKRGHQVTLFTRGKTHPDLFPEAERLTGDRNVDLSALKNRTWDAVIDTCGYAPSVVRASAEALQDRVAHYTFVSSISAYAELKEPGIREDAPLGQLNEATEEVTGDTYGPLKALCEAEVERVFGERALIVRPGLIVGPFDPTGRFTYWPTRIAKGGDVLAPGDPEAEVQVIDGRDLALWIVVCAERGTTGVFNATGPLTRLTMRRMLETAIETLNPAARLVWTSEKFLLDNNVGPWMELPVWLPADDGGVMSVDIGRALDAGLSFRPLPETMRDTFEWQQTAPDPSTLPTPTGNPRPKAGMEESRERALLNLWQQGSGQ